jgi:sodium/potassium/calcium exchanger 6
VSHILDTACRIDVPAWRNMDGHSSSSSSSSGVDGDGDNCSIPRNATRGEQCAWVVAHQACHVESHIDYLQLYLCSNVTHSTAAVIMAVTLLWWCVLVCVLGSSADEYFCQPLASTAGWLQLRPRVAAVTLLVLANAAPDIFAIRAAFERGDTALAVSSMSGCGLFVICCVLPVMIWFSREPIAVSGIFFRDTLCYVSCVGLVIALLVIREVHLWMPIVMISAYPVFVAVVLNSHRLKPCCAPDKAGQVMAGDVQEKMLPGNYHAMSTNSETSASGSWADEMREITEWGGRSCVGRAVWAVQAPFNLARALTIPTFIRESKLGGHSSNNGGGSGIVLAKTTHKALIVLSSIGFPVLVCAYVQQEVIEDDFRTAVLGCPLVAVVAVCAVPLALTLALLLVFAPRRFGCEHRQGGATEIPAWLHRALTVGALVGSVVWIDLISSEVVDILQSLGFIFDIPTAMLGQTVLSWGNAVGDLFASAALVRRGHTKMAIGGCFAAVIFTPLCGFGGMLLMKTIHSYPAPYRGLQLNMAVGNVLAFEAGVPTVLLLVVASFAMCTKRWELGRTAGASLLLMYCCFLAAVASIAVGGRVNL